MLTHIEKGYLNKYVLIKTYCLLNDKSCSIVRIKVLPCGQYLNMFVNPHNVALFHLLSVYRTGIIIFVLSL